MKAAMFLTGFLFLVLALAGPRWGLREEIIESRGMDIVLAVDLSISMLTEDVPPNRLERAKLELASFIDSRGGDRIGIVAFAGDAFTACPLTTDYGAVKNFLGALKAGSIPSPGTNLSKAIILSAEMLEGYPSRKKAVLLLTDGEETAGTPLKALRKLNAVGAALYTVGFGTEAGGPIPLYDDRGKITDYKRKTGGEVVISRLNETLLTRMAELGKGAYYSGGDALSQLEASLAGKGDGVISSRMLTRLEERFQYPLLLSILFLALEAMIPEWRKSP